MRKTITTTAAVAAAALAATAVTSGAAVAATVDERDSHNDMAHGADIHSVRVINEKSVRVVLRVDDLVRSWRSGASVTVYVDTDPTDAGPEFAILGGMFEGTDYGLVRTEGWKVGDHPRVVRGFHSMTLDYEKDVARFRMSREALDHPDAVRVEVRTSGEQRDGDVVHDWLGERREFTPWVRKG